MIIVSVDEGDYERRTEDMPMSGDNHDENDIHGSATAESFACENADGMEEEKSTFQKVADECIINLFSPCENLPFIGPGELNVIGRWITFQAEYSINPDKNSSSSDWRTTSNLNCQGNEGDEEHQRFLDQRNLNGEQPEEASESSEWNTMYFSGLVSAVTAETISLVYVTRYSKTSFAEIERVKKSLEESTSLNKRRNTGECLSDEVPGEDVAIVEISTTFSPYHLFPNEEGGGVEEDGSPNAKGSAFYFLPKGIQAACSSVSSSLYGENATVSTSSGGGSSTSCCSQPLPELGLPMDSDKTILLTRSSYSYFLQTMFSKIHSRKRLTIADEDYIAPFMSFSRKKIHNVQYGIDPPPIFYSLLRSAANPFLHLQCLRLFVRRFLVLSSQGCNPQHIPLQVFIARCYNFPEIEGALLLKIAKEELINLLEVQAEIKRMNDALPSRRAVHSGGIGGLEQEDVETIRWRQDLDELLGDMRKYLEQTLLVYLLGIVSSLLALFLFSDVKVIRIYLESYDKTYNFFFLTLLVGFMITRVHLAVTLPQFFLRMICPLFLILQVVLSTIVYMSSVSLFFAAITALPVRKLESFLLREISSNDLILTYQALHCTGFYTSCPSNLVHQDDAESVVVMERAQQVPFTSSFPDLGLSTPPNASYTWEEDSSSIYALLWCPKNMTVSYNVPCAPRLAHEVRRMTYPFIFLSIVMIVFLLKSFWVFRRFFIGRIWLLS